jgi:DNA-binding NarL/FixJ family response regulator
MLDGLKSIIKSDKAFELVGEALNGNDAYELIKNETVDLLLTDINMPGMGGIELTQKTKALKPETKVLVLSMYSEKGMISEMLSAGASGYILKNTGREELLGALHKVAIGGMYFSDDVAAEMMKAMVTPKPAATETIKLTPREIEIIQLIDKEYNNAAIAEKLFISERTVETHRKNIFRKTKTKGVVGLLKLAVEQGIL